MHVHPKLRSESYVAGERQVNETGSVESFVPVLFPPKNGPTLTESSLLYFDTETRYTTPAPSSDTRSEQSVLILELTGNEKCLVR